MSLFVQVSMLTDDGDSANTVVNTWTVGNATVGDAPDVLAAFDNFYGTVPSGQANTVSSFFSAYLQTTSGLRLKAYDLTGHLDGTSMGAPVDEMVSSLTTPQAGEALPSHLACVLTLEGAGRADAPVELPGPPVTRPKQRKTGRVYLGPLNVNAIGAGPSNDAAPDATFRATVFAAIAELRDELAAIDPNRLLSVWSRANAALLGVDAVSMDDALDVVKTRKRATTTRTRVLI